jgi:hypothetical protein
VEFLSRRIKRARAEVWPTRRSGLPASAELLRVHADPKSTRTCCGLTLEPFLASTRIRSGDIIYVTAYECPRGKKSRPDSLDFGKCLWQHEWVLLIGEWRLRSANRQHKRANGVLTFILYC